MKTFEIPEEPEEGTRVIGQSGVLYTNMGSWTPWHGTDGNQYDWTEMLIEDGPVREIVAPVEAIKRLKTVNFYGTQNQEDVASLIEFAEAFV